MRALALLMLGLVAGCNSADLTNGAGPGPTATASPHPSVTALPSPTGSPNVPEPTAHDCGNADYQVWAPTDPDDPPGQQDAFWCYWLCSVDPGDPAHGYPPDPNPPNEVFKEYDDDSPAAIYQFGPTLYLPCYAAKP